MVEKIIDPAELSDYERGYIEGMRAYAWWRGGEEYVGTAGTTLKNAIKYFLRSRGKDIPDA